MRCEDIRAALSARLDGEESDLPEEVVDAHLAGCADCQRWYATVTALGRELRINRAPMLEPGVDSDAAAQRVMSAVDSLPQVTSTLRARQMPLLVSRLVLAGLAAVYVVWAALALFGAPLGIAGPDIAGSGASLSTPAGAGAAGGSIVGAEDPVRTRLIIDAATTRFALGAGLAWASFRPRAASAMLPVYLAMWAFGAGFATRDIVMGLISSAEELPAIVGSLAIHLVAVGALVTCWLARLHAVAPLSQSLRWLGAKPMSFSATDVDRFSTYRPGD